MYPSRSRFYKYQHLLQGGRRMQSNGRVVLRAEVLYAGSGCPVCGDKKTVKARTCRACYEVLGNEITRRVDTVIETHFKATMGNAAAAQGNFNREVVFGPILAQVKIDKDAILHKAMGGIEAYFDCSKSVPGGFVSVYVFGAGEEKRGKEVTAIAHLKTKEHRPGDRINYIRAQVVPDVIKSDVKLQLTRLEEAGTLVSSLPIQTAEEGKEKKRRYAVGFQYA